MNRIPVSQYTIFASGQGQFSALFTVWSLTWQSCSKAVS